MQPFLAIQYHSKYYHKGEDLQDNWSPRWYSVAQRDLKSPSQKISYEPTMSSAKLVLEVCVDSVQSAVSAAGAGANRLEVCGNLGIGGGTTPSLGLVRAIQRAVPHIPIMAMIRPRVGDFLYSEEELDVMLEDIGLFKTLGIAGVVFGILDRNGTVDVPRTRMCVFELAKLCKVCFHRAVDMTRSAVEAFDAISAIRGITRVLTSGQSTSAQAGLHVLQELLRRSQTSDGPVILPGAGINPGSIRRVLDDLLPYGLKEVHMSGGRWTESEMIHRSEGMGMGASAQNDWGIWLTDGKVIREMRSIVDNSASSEPMRSGN
ncbi:copper homeostasis CutC domain-containing protein [Lactarius vividus]|nr:copper homeostasis CutC domain-containing protein [Lactarius vividus]